MDIEPIRTEEEFRAGLAEIERLWGTVRPGTPEGLRFEILGALVEAYEIERCPIDPPDPIEAIRFRLEQQGLSRKSLKPVMGTRSRVSEILSGKRKLTLAMIRGIHRVLGIPVDVLVGDLAGAPPKKARP
jgi:HTH-type transcriptional regulator / antitoxin HigA